MLLSFYHRFVMMWCCSSSCYGVLCEGTIQTNKTDSINQKYQIMVVSMLKNWSRRYYSHYIIKFVSFMLIYYAINLDIVSFYKVFSYLYLESIDLLQV